MKMNELVSWFQLEYSHLVKEMKVADHHLTFADNQKAERILGYGSTPENINPYHQEGDIFCHTMMVCKQAENMPYEVQIAALLHDIGKPSTRAVNPKNGRVSFFNHDAVSAFMSLEILKREELGLTDEQRVMIFNMIALHTQVYKLTPQQLANIGDMNLVRNLILLGNADHEGRFHSHEGSKIPTFEDVLHEYEVSHYEDKEKEVIVLVGPPASGKSSYVEKYIGEYSLISRDNCLMDLATEKFGTKNFTYQNAWDSIRQKKVDIILNDRFKEWQTGRVFVDMTHMSKKSRRRSLSHFGPEYKKKAVVFLTDLPTLFERNEKREGKVIDRSVIDRMIRSFYPATYEEFDEIEYVLT